MRKKNQPRMQEMDTLHHLKEQLKIRTLDLRKATADKEKLTRNMKDLVAYNQGEINNLKNTIQAKNKEIEEQQEMTWAARMATHTGKIERNAGSPRPEKTDANAGKRDRTANLPSDIDELLKRVKSLKVQVEEEREKNKRVHIQKEGFIRELNQLRQDSKSVDSLKKKMETMKSSLALAQRTARTSGIITQDLVREKDLLIEKYEEMLYGDFQTGNISPQLPSEIISNLKEDLELLEEDKNQLILELDMVREDNAQMESKFSLLEEHIDSSETMEYRTNIDSRGATSAEFSAGLETFLITYSDMITIILVIFVLLYVISQVDVGKFSEALSSIQNKKLEIKSVDVRLNKDEVKMLARVRELVKDNVDPETLVRSDVKTIIIRLKSGDLFPPGSAKLNPSAERLITDSIREEIREGVKQVTVDGHTDDVPIKTGNFPSNWELSSARASRVARVIIDTLRFPPERMMVSGYGSFRPLKPNTSDLNRAMNRRVEIKILKDKNVAREEEQQPIKVPETASGKTQGIDRAEVSRGNSSAIVPQNIRETEKAASP